MKKVYIGADHRGYPLKEKIAQWLLEWGYPYEDMGAYALNETDDYPEFAEKVASMVVDDKSSLGILLCGSGVGVEVVANKFDGIRASVAKSASQIKAGRQDDDMNVLVIASDFTSEEEALGMVKIFLETKFDGKARHERRLEDITRIEENN